MSVLTPGRIRLSCVSANGKIPKSSLFMVGELFPDVPVSQSYLWLKYKYIIWMKQTANQTDVE